MKMTTFSAKAHPSVKGIYLAIFLIFFAIPILAQVEKKDNTPVSQKWEVGFDLKPLFRSDQPYNVMAKWHFTEKKAVRLRIGSASSTSSSDSIWLLNYDEILVGISKLQFYENYPKRNKKINGQFSIGYQYSFIKRQISFYSATEFNYEQAHEDFNTFGASKAYSNLYLRDSLKSNIFYNKQSLFYLKYRVKTMGISQIIGIDYKFNNHLSISSEFAFSFHRTSHYLSKDEQLPSNSSVVIGTYSGFTSSGTNNEVFFKPLLGLYLNYHF